MKRVFQWRRYLEWNDLTGEEKLVAKRFLLVPLIAYFFFAFIPIASSIAPMYSIRGVGFELPILKIR